MSETGFTPAASSLYFSKGDSEDLRWGEKVQRLEGLKSLEDLSARLKNKSSSFVLAGYPDDEGISLSGGRIGAKEAPDVIRNYLYRTTYVPSSDLFDLGNLSLEVPLAERHERGRRACATTLKAGSQWIGLGGGHDYGYADGAGFLDVYQDLNPVIVNFDAHLDVRPHTKGFSSGTPFRRLLENYSGFSFWEVGLLRVCNSPHHIQWAQDKGAKIYFWEDIQKEHYAPEHVFHDLLQRSEPSPLFISIDLDVLSSDSAPGCSQTWPSAMTLAWLGEALGLLRRNCQVKVMSFYETSPPLDIDGRTSKLVAQCIHRLLQD